MLNFVLRKFTFKNASKEAMYSYALIKDRIKMFWLADFLVYIFGVLPLVFMLMSLICCIRNNESIDNFVFLIICPIAYICFLIYFMKRFGKCVTNFILNIGSTLYFNKYVIKGNAISKDDFNNIKKENEILYCIIKNVNSQGYCYRVCFELLKTLQKGSILFIAIKPFDEEESKEYGYTMHVLYVNNDWCFNTFSGRQHPLEEALSRHYAKTYTSYSYDDIKDKTYEEFKKDEFLALKKWCIENDCYQKWSKEE